jgi:hypothetical protein
MNDLPVIECSARIAQSAELKGETKTILGAATLVDVLQVFISQV